jgi:hypothetical protein
MPSSMTSEHAASSPARPAPSSDGGAGGAASRPQPQQPQPGGVPGTQAEAPVSPPGIDAALAELTRWCRKLERDELAERVTAAGARLKRPATVVCIVGEFKQGKSSLVNGLLGNDVCPVDDDLATSAITMVRYGDQLGAVVRRRVEGKAVAERAQIDELTQWVSEIGNPGNAKGVERVEISVPSAMLKQGLVLVDTPGMGGLGAGHAAATLAFLPFADGVVLASDASAELSAPELNFLRRATELCPTVLFVQTKIDLHPGWERIVERNRGHLRTAGIDVDIVAVSSMLRHEALARKDRELNQSSRFPEVISALGSKVIEPAKASATDRSKADGKAVAALLMSGLNDEKALLTDSALVAGKMAELEAAKSHLEQLRGPASKWGQLLGDRVGELSASINHHMRSAMRTISKLADDRVEVLTKGEEWDELSAVLQRDIADAIAEVFAEAERARVSIRIEIATLLEGEDVALAPLRSTSRDVDVSALWRDKSLDDTGSRGKRGFQTGLTGLKGAQSGVMMFGMVGGFLPAAATVFMASNPILLGVGAVFGGMQLAEDRKRKVTQRRQAAKTQVRQFVDDVQFDVGNEITSVIREVQRELRDEFSERLTELQRTYTDTMKRIQEDVQRSQTDRQQRVQEVTQSLAALTKIAAAL